ncbi:fatty-acid amide hydrolase [Pochonia chlamydosporia 170]|uniref:Fatty-acid amide hydrolase n=1 Tax=Pochonia chlamydosporia 170 TaxID=1380566 RepID=A0A179EY93_METCM|nr:fatty-acid amide hydrolase [Pochonia chlamydosporia 170]OAQ58167.1 fatty-acid amide hydrolase [Pochonia chlamydosporia 170]
MAAEFKIWPSLASRHGLLHRYVFGAMAKCPHHPLLLPILMNPLYHQAPRTAGQGLLCAALGIGTDIGGSVRVPAAFCGVYGLRTTALRNPYKGVCIPGRGQESIHCVISPLANSVADLDLFQGAVLDREPWEEETSLVPLPWKRIGPFQPAQITLGVIWDDECVPPHPPVTRALKYAVSKLRQSGTKVVDFAPYNHQEGWDIVSALYFPDGARTQKDILASGGEPVAFLTEWAFSVSNINPISVTENWELNIRRDAYRETYHHIMKDRGVDFILCPAYVGAAATLGGGQYVHYTSVWNVLDMPSITFPTGLKVDPVIDTVCEYQFRSAVDERESKKYTPETYVAAPIALQLVGKHFRDEETVAAADLVSRIIQE